MLKTSSLLIILFFVTGNVLTQGSDDSGEISPNGHISILPFDPIGFVNFILRVIVLPFRVLGGIFGLTDSSNPLAPCGEISVLPFFPIRFIRFIFYIISLPFRVIGNLFGFEVSCRNMGKSGGSQSESGEESEGGSGGESGGGSQVSKGRDFFDVLLGIPQGVFRFIEEVLYLMRLFHYKTFGDLESGAAYLAGDGEKSQRYREVRNRNVTAQGPAS